MLLLMWIAFKIAFIWSLWRSFLLVVNVLGCRTTKIAQRGVYGMIQDKGYMILEGHYNNCSFEAYYDASQDVLHILDAMGRYGTNRSVTNTVNDLLLIIDRALYLDGVYAVFLYGTNNIISEYSTLYGFRYIHKKDEAVFPYFLDRMEEMYKR